MGSGMKDAAAHSSDGAEQGVVPGAVVNDFASYSIFLFIEGEGGEGCWHKGSFGGRGDIQTSLSKKELDIF